MPKPLFPTLDHSLILELHRALVRINSVGLGLKGCESGEKGMMEYLRQWLDHRNIVFSEQDLSAGRANIMATVPGRDKRTLLLTAHMDTVSTAGMEIAPFDPVERDGRVYGRGACDTKASVAGMLGVLAAWAKSSEPPPWSLAFLATCAEETTFEGAEAFAKAPPFPVHAIVVGEPTLCRPVVAHKAVARHILSIPGRAAHGATPQGGLNAIERMARVICFIKEKITPDLVRFTHPLCGHNTLNIGTINGGTQVNFVPDCCEIHIDQRMVPNVNPKHCIEEMERAVLEYARSIGINDATFTETLFSPGMDTAPKNPFVQACLKACQTDAPGGVPYSTDAGSLSRLGVPCVVLGPGSIEQAHRSIEYVEKAQIKACTEMYCKISASATADWVNC